MLLAKAPGIRGLRRLGRRSGIERRPGRGYALVGLVEDVDAGHPVLPSAPAPVDQDPQEAQSKWDRREDQADQPPQRLAQAETVADRPQPDPEEVHPRGLPRQRPEDDEIETAECDPGSR